MIPEKRAGEPISAADWNRVVRACNREVRGPNVVADGLGWTVFPTRAGGEGLTLYQVKLDGGDPGGPTIAPTYTYSLFQQGVDVETEPPFATEVPLYYRFHPNRVHAAPDGSLAVAAQLIVPPASEPAWYILLCGEADELTICTPPGA